MFTPKSRRILVVCALAVTGGSACDRAGDAPLAGVVDVPFPEISAFDESVQTQIQDQRGRLEQAEGARPPVVADVAEAYGALGMLYHAYKSLDAARACYTNARHLAPGTHRWAYYLGLVLRDQGNPDGSVEAFGAGLELSPRHLNTLLQLAETEFELRRLDEAERHFQRALEEDSNCALALAGLGRIALARKDYAGAIEAFERCLSLAPGFTDLNYSLGLAYRGLGQVDRARELMATKGKVRVQPPDPLRAAVEELRIGKGEHFRLGNDYYRAGELEKARDEFQKALEVQPDHAKTRANLGSVLTRLGDLEGAAEQFQVALRLEPENAVTNFNMGTLWGLLGEDEKAVPFYTKALALDRTNADCHFNLANALRRLGRFREAIPHYREVTELNPGHAPAYLAWSLAELRLDRDAASFETARQAYDAFPEHDEIGNLLARLLAAAPSAAVRDGAEALALARLLVARSKTLDHVETLAMAFAETGDFESAVVWQEAALQTAQGRDVAWEAVLRDNLERYRARKPCRAPWPQDGVVLSPPPNRPPRGSK